MAEPKMPDVPDYYFNLGLEMSACDRDIRVAYLRLAQQYHPDKRGSAESVDAIEFRKVNEAYCFLRDERQRKEYDETYMSIITNWTKYRVKYAAWVKKKEVAAQAKESAKEAAEQKKKQTADTKAKKPKGTAEEKKKLAAEAKANKAKEAAEKKKAAECAKEMKKFQAEQMRKEREERARKFREAQEEREKNEAAENIKQGREKHADQYEKEEPLRTDSRYHEYINGQRHKEWAQNRHKAYLKKNGLKGHESSVADAYIELDWVKETAVKKCDDCTRKCKHFQYSCPSGGLIVCPPCKARYSCYGA